MKVSPKSAALFVALAAVCIPSVSAQTNSPQKIGLSAVWQMPDAFRTATLKKCGDATQPSNFGQCFINQMPSGGASPQAVAFTRALYQANGGDVGILTGFHKVGPVDIAWVTYPLRANTNYGLLFVNGQPSMINVEDLKLLDQATMQQDPQFQNTKAQFPNAAVWPGDRDGTTWPNSQPGPNGGVQFTVGYPLINGCHACEHVGVAMFNWNFDPQGKFKGTTFMGMTPPPVQ